MLTSYPVYGFGAAPGAPGPTPAPTLAQLLHQAAQRQRSSRRGPTGLGIAFTGDYQGFLSGGQSATYKDAQNIVFCNKDSANRPQCVLNSAVGAAARSGPIANMQRAVDRIMNAIPAFKLGGRQMTAPLPTGDGTTTTDQTFTILDNGPNPIQSRSGYDGVVGASTQGFTGEALILAGMLKQVPNSVALPFVSPGREDIYAIYSNEIAAYLNDVANNFQDLLADFTARGNVPASTPLDVTTIPAVVPIAGEKRLAGKAAVIGAGVAMVSLTGLAAFAAANKKPMGLYRDVSPAFGRRRHRSHPRGW